MAATEVKDDLTEKSSIAERQLVALHLGGEIYGVDIASIHSVLTPQPITAVPNVPSFVKGVMNLRGLILPVLDLRTRFGLPPLEPERRKFSRIVIVEAEGYTAGLIVDAVSEVLKLPANAIEPPSSLLGSADQRCISGIGRVCVNVEKSKDKTQHEHLILLLNVVEVLSGITKLTEIAA